MPHAVATLYDDNYRDLAELTNEPKIEYCERYGLQVLRTNRNEVQQDHRLQQNTLYTRTF